jgi:hypothetical protein
VALLLWSWCTSVFKKRPKFLNSAPTSTECALRLLSSPSGSGCISTNNAHNETGQMAVCCQNLPLDALSSRSVPPMLVGALFEKFRLF